jgi:NAD+ kinase
MQQFSVIGIISRRDNPELVDTLLALTAFLQRRPDTRIVLDEAVSALLGTHPFEVRDRTQMGGLCELVIVVGGDGSMLKAAPLMADQDIPVVGINRGRLGFLTDIRPEEIELALGPILEGHYNEESRFLLEATQTTDKGDLILGAAMNDVVLHPGRAAQMIEFELYIDGRFVYNQASDGLIVATPTGSTAYAMSAGGPIMHPKLDALVLVPMYPHSLSSRPIVVDSDSSITLIIGARQNIQNIAPQISCDGSVVHGASVGDTITIRRKQKELKLLHPIDYDYYATCRSKLHWSHRPGK